MINDDSAARGRDGGLVLVRGNPAEAEVAALLVVLSALEPPDPGPAPAVGGWADRAAGLRPPLRPGPGAWRASARR